VGTIKTKIIISSSEPKDLCLDCQLNQPCFELKIGPCKCDLEKAEKNPLSHIISSAQDDLRFREQLLQNPRHVFSEHGLSLTKNIVVKVEYIDAAMGEDICPECGMERCKIRIVTGDENNVCCCKEYVLFEVIYDECRKRGNW
jgi:hypothetical protein